MQKKAILRDVAKLRLDIEGTGGLTPVMLRLEAEGEAVRVARVLRADDRLAEVWWDVETTGGERLTLRFVRETLRCELHTVETDRPEWWQGWSSRERERDTLS